MARESRTRPRHVAMDRGAHRILDDEIRSWSPRGRHGSDGATDRTNLAEWKTCWRDAEEAHLHVGERRETWVSTTQRGHLAIHTVRMATERMLRQVAHDRRRAMRTTPRWTA